LFPGHDQVWRMRSFAEDKSPPGAAC
jgi:hypothetical protein